LNWIACDEYGLKSEGLDTAAGQSVDEEECDVFCIDLISPNQGPVSGGTQVTITGVGFNGNIGVSFGRLDLTVSRVDSRMIVVTSPAAPGEQSVDVTVWSDDGEETIEGGFLYTDTPNSNNDTGGTDTGGNDTGGGSNNGSGTGLTGGIIKFGLQVDPYHLLSTQDYILNASINIHNPGQGSWLDWIAPVGQCSWNLEPSAFSVSAEPMGSWAYLNSGAQSVSLQPTVDANGNNIYSANNLSHTTYLKGAGYDLSIPDIGLEIQDAVITSGGLGNFSPQDIFSSATPQYNYYQNGLTTFTWDPDTDPNTTMWFIVQVYDPAATYLGGFQCRTSDNGAYAIPGNLFDGALTGDSLVIQMQRVRLGTAIHPQNGSTLETFSVTGGIGLATFIQ